MNQFNVVEYIGSQEGLFLPVITEESVIWEKEKQFAIQAFQSNDFLMKTAMNNQNSLQNALINVATIGISLNPAEKHAYLVPRDGKVCLDISYMGLLHLAQLSGSIMWGQCKLVFSMDSYSSNGLDKAPAHNYNPFGDRGDVVGAYCTVKLPSGDFLTDEMSKEEIIKIQNSSKAKNGPWKTHWNEMARKTVVKRSAKYWPTVSRLATAIQHLNTDGGEGLVATEKDITPAPAENYGEKLISLFAGKPKDKYLPWLTQKLGREVLALEDITADESVKVIEVMENAKS
jgi:recombination protein RecT